MINSATSKDNITTMKALVFHGPNNLALEDRPRPTLKESTDAIVRITTTSICGTDLHILKGDVPTVTDGRIANVCVHGKPVELHLEKLVSHRFQLSEILKAYDTYANAAKEHAVKVVIKNGDGAP